MVGLNPDSSRVGIFIAVLCLESLTAITMGLFISAMSPTVDAANAIGPPLMIVSILFGGFYINIDSLPIVANWIPYISFVKWAFQALCINEFSGALFTCDDSPTGSCEKTGDAVVQRLGFGQASAGEAVFGLGMIIAGFFALAYTTLHYSKIHYMPLGTQGAKYSLVSEVDFTTPVVDVEENQKRASNNLDIEV